MAIENMKVKMNHFDAWKKVRKIIVEENIINRTRSHGIKVLHLDITYK